MSVPNRQIGWSNESNLLWEITRQLDRLTKVTQSSIENSNLFVADTPVGVSATTIGGVVLSFTATPIFNNLYKSFSFNYPLVNLTYPVDGEKLQAFSSIANPILGGSPTEGTINGIEAFANSSANSFIAFSNVLSITKLTINDLKYIFQIAASPAGISTSGGLKDISMPDLEFTAVNLSFTTGSPIINFDFPKLKVGGLTVQNIAIQTLNVPEAVQFSITDTTNSSLQSLNLPKVKVTTSINLTGTKALLTSILLPSIEYCSGITFPTTSTSLSTFTFGSSLKMLTGNFITTSNSLDQASVDNILISLAALDGTNDTFIFNGRTVTITGGAATPSAAGLAAKAILVSRGCTVTNN